MQLSIKKTIYIRLGGVVLILLWLPFIYSSFNDNFYKKWSSTLKRTTKDLILPYTIDADTRLPVDEVDVVYIMGGNQQSLLHKFRSVHEICEKLGCRRILMLHRAGITEYSRSVGRNLSNDEWALSRMKELGLPENKIDFIKMEGGFFGTYNEAKHISRRIIKKSYRSVLLVTGTYHTKRVRLSFKKFLQDAPSRIFVLGSGETGSALDRLSEFIKLKFYQLCLV